MGKGSLQWKVWWPGHKAGVISGQHSQHEGITGSEQKTARELPTDAEVGLRREKSLGRQPGDPIDVE